MYHTTCDIEAVPVTIATQPQQLPISRRRCLTSMAGSLCIISTTRGEIPASEKISLGVIGLGSRGFYLLEEVLKRKDLRVTAVCDVDSLHYRDRKWKTGKPFGRQAAKIAVEKKYGSNSGLEVADDYRKVCAREDIDAIVVATPDHWHALCTLAALKNGKDVYCEKPVTHTFREGQLVCQAVKKHKGVFQTGSQQRSDFRFRRAVNLVRNGHLGRIRRVEVGLPPGYEKPQGESRVTKPPSGLDYEFWCGPAEVLPYMRARHHRWWRGHRVYGGGVLMDWIGHHNDIAHWAMNRDNSGPVSVEAVGWTFPENRIYNTPHQYEIRCEYDNGIKSSISSRHAIGTRFIGEEGWLHVTRGRLMTSDPNWVRDDFDIGQRRVYDSDSHLNNFIECVRSRKDCIAPAETGHRSITPGHLGYVSHQLGRAIKWDPEKESATNDERANEILQRLEYRKPWGSVL